MEQIDIFEMGIEYHYRPPLYFDRPIRLFEAFAGVGCQAMAFKRARLPYVSVGISEIDKPAIKSYEAIHGKTANYGDIKLMGEIPPCDVFTWSFPCTDISKSGKRAGMNGDTRSGLVYEVLRLLKNTKQKPICLIMENVPDLVQEAFKAQFYEIQKEIESHGHKNFTLTLNAKNFGVAQNRDRVFMVSLLGDYHYEFPMPIKLDKRLKDYLEDSVDEKYYLSERAIEGIQNTSFNTTANRIQNKDYCDTICARDYKDPKCIQVGTLEGKGFNEMTSRVYGSEGLSPTIITQSFMPSIAIPEATEKGYALAQEGDGVYINRPHQKRCVVQKGKIQALKTSGNDVGVVVATNLKSQMCNQLIANGKVKEYDVVRHSYTNSRMVGKMNDIQENNMSPTIDTRADCLGVVTHELRIRKLTPRECWRLMGIADEDFDKAAAVCSNSQLYKQAGNGIVVDVFAAILNNLIEYQPKGKE